MKDDRLATALRDARVPRYTSYPPANRFTPQVGATEAANWIARVDPEQPISLYIHVPFCRRLCWFCACRTQGTKSNAPIDRYLQHLAQEVAIVSSFLPPKAQVGHLHLGGGTPTILSAARIQTLATWLHDSFDIQPSAKVSVEIDPCDCDANRLDALMQLGMNRVSIGVQDFDAQVQDTIGRHQSVAATNAIVQGARDRGISSINFDLIYGLPFQTKDTLRKTLQTVIALRPDRLALYGYAHVPWMAKRQRMTPEAALPDPDARLALAALAREMLLGAGYVPVGIDHFALPGDSLALAASTGHLRRNFQGYTTDDAATLIGMGPSAISSFPDGIAQNAPATGAWQAKISEGRLATARGHIHTRTDKAAAAIISALMCNGTAQIRKIAETCAVDADQIRRRAQKAIDDLPGIGRLIGDVLEAKDTSTVRLLCGYFDPGLDAEANRYSLVS